MEETNNLATAKEGYEAAFSLVSQMAETTASAAKEQGIEYDPQDTLIKFDIVMQYSLLQLAAADENIHPAEIEYISQLTKKGDMMQYLATLSGVTGSWEDLEAALFADVKEMIDGLSPYMDEIADELGGIFVWCQQVAPDPETLDAFTTMIVDTVTGVIAADGTVDERELGSVCLILRVVNETKRQLAQA